MAHIAIEFGTKHTKYAYSLSSSRRSMFESRFKDLLDGGENIVSTKTLSSILIDDKGQFHSFGLKAEYHFASLERENDIKGFRLFRRFPNTLQIRETISGHPTVADHDGGIYSAKDIFAMAIKYLHDHFISDLRFRTQDIRDSEIMFVFTVQDKWGEMGKSFIYNAAIKAGIDAGKLHTVFQSEAAVMWYINSDLTNLKSSGHSYIVVNQEGDAIYLTELQKQDQHTFKIVHSETRVRTCREQFILERFFDKNVLKDVRKNHAYGYFELIDQIERKARKIETLPIDESWIWMRMATELRTLCRVEYFKSNNDVKGDKIRLHLKEIKSRFEKEIGENIELVRNYMTQNSRNIQSMILLGDIAYSVHIQDRFAKELCRINVKALINPEFDVLQGALLKAYEDDTGLEPLNENFLLVAAFDFGTTFSGYGYSWTNDTTRVIIPIWHSNDPSASLSSQKTPTSVLLDDKGQFHSFGFEAEDTFAALAEQNKHSGWRLFRGFKMILHSNKHLSRKSTIKDVSGKDHEALPIFVMAIQALKKYLFDAIQDRVKIIENEIRYIITVPAIWDVGAKQFMREAAVEAGICSDRLLLAYESEAAALWCTQTDEHATDTKHIVIDLGGGTADISVFQRMKNKTIKVIHKASGGAWGGNSVNQQFVNYFDNQLGNGVLDELRETNLEDYLTLARDFENKKRSDHFVDTFFRLRIPLSLLNIAQTRQLNVSINIDKMRIETSEIKSWFEIPICPLIEHVRLLLAEDGMNDIQSVILCGGFADSKYVKERLRQEFNGINFIVPNDAGLAVLRGAVLFGHNPKILASRVMTHTYGISVCNRFDIKTHPKEKKFFCRVEGDWQASDCFAVFVQAGEEIPFDHRVRHYFMPLCHVTEIFVFRTLSKNPSYTTDPGCELIGSLTIENTLNIPFKEQECGITFMFGHTELLVKAKNMTNNKEEMLTLDCLQ